MRADRVWSRHRGSPVDGHPGSTCTYAHEVDPNPTAAAIAPSTGDGAHLAELGLVDSLDGASRRCVRSYGLHLHGDDLRTESNHEIDLATADSEVAADDLGATPRQEVRGDTLTPSRQLRGQILVGCSISSMLMSRKVSTLTCFTKRAGRYMSHTQASPRSSSK